MKKMILTIYVALVVGFTAAVGLCVRVIAAPTPVSAEQQTMRIVLDAGHGGIDGGVVGKKTGSKESDLNLSIAYKCKAVLDDMGFETFLTRKTEAGLYDTATRGFKKRDMQNRKTLIEKVNPSLVISIHQNFYPSQKTRGAQVFYLKNHEGGKLLATGLQKRLNELYASDGARGRVQAAGEFFMLKCAPCPSVIVECGFLSNADDERLLTSETWQKRLAETIGSGVLSYFSAYTG